MKSKIIILDGEKSRYKIFEDGKIYNIESNKFLKGYLHSCGYWYFNLRHNNKTYLCGLHRLMAEYFLENNEPKIKNIVNHIDGNKLNNNLNNLEWVTSAENQNHALSLGLKRKGNLKYSRQKYISDFEGEQWKCYHNSIYYCSNYGRVRNNETGYCLSGSLCSSGYRMYNLIINKQKISVFAQKLIYYSFYPEQEGLNLVINHIDGDKDNNILTNLEAISYQDNALHGIYILGKKKIVSVCKYDLNDILLAKYPSIAEASRQNPGYNATNISRACNRKSHIYKDFKWYYADNCKELG